MSYAPPCPARAARDQEIIRLYNIMTGREVSEKLGLGLSVVEEVVRRRGIRKGPARHGKQPFYTALRARKAIDQSDDLRRMDRDADACDRLLEALKAHHVPGTGELRMARAVSA